VTIEIRGRCPLSLAFHRLALAYATVVLYSFNHHDHHDHLHHLRESPELFQETFIVNLSRDPPSVRSLSEYFPLVANTVPRYCNTLKCASVAAPRRHRVGGTRIAIIYRAGHHHAETIFCAVSTFPSSISPLVIPFLLGIRSWSFLLCTIFPIYCSSCFSLSLCLSSLSYSTLTARINMGATREILPQPWIKTPCIKSTALSRIAGWYVPMLPAETGN
jgi:hypothetical protein